MTTEISGYDETVTDIEETLGILPGYLEALPERELVNEWPNLKRFLFGEAEIDPKTREFVGLAMAAAIGCEFCRHFHKGAAQLHGVTEDELSELYFLASYTPRYSALIQAQDYDINVFKEEPQQIAEHLQAQDRSDPRFINGIHHVAEHVTDSQVREIDGTGHMGPIHNPEAVADEVTRFLATGREVNDS